jgi:hypothetical protein
MKPETIRALTPIILATIGGAIGIAVLIAPGINEAKWTAGFGLAGTAIAGAAGLAQSTKSESSVSVQEKGQNIQAQGNSSDHSPAS